MTLKQLQYDVTVATLPHTAIVFRMQSFNYLLDETIKTMLSYCETQ